MDRAAWALAVAVVPFLSCHYGPSPTAPTEPSAVQAAASLAPERTLHEVEVDGHGFAVHRKSAAEPRDVIVLVHGRTWSGVPDFDLQVPGERRSLMDALVAEGFATYAVDLRGYGGTKRDDSGWLTPERAAADLVGLLEWVGARHSGGRAPILFGWSYGSMVSQLTVQQRPDLVSDLVLFGYPAKPGNTYPDDPAKPGQPPRKKNTATAAASDFITPEVITPAAIDAYVAACLEADTHRVDWTALQQWNALDPAKVTVPTLVIHGEHDPYAPLEHQARLFQGLGHPDRAWVIVAGGDHAAHMEDTMPRFVQALVSFVRRPRRG